MSRNWQAVADAIERRMSELDMSQGELIQRSGISPMMVREIRRNASSRRRNPRTLAALSEALALPKDYLLEISQGRTPEPSPSEANDPVLAELASIRDELRAMRSRLEVLERYVIDQQSTPLAMVFRPEQQPVVAAVVTSPRGALIGRRQDGTPPWTFIAGEIEPGESPVDAAIREVKEETGLLVVAEEQELGRRVHPKTGRTMIYLACVPTKGTDVFVGDPDELAEVRWASIEEVETLLPGLFPPVHRHLAEMLGTATN